MNITCPEARKIFKNKPEMNFSKIVQSATAKPTTKNGSTQYVPQASIISFEEQVYTKKKTKKKKHTEQISQHPEQIILHLLLQQKLIEIDHQVDVVIKNKATIKNSPRTEIKRDLLIP